MKKIIFIRHAKSSWNSGVSRDIDRPLNARGKNDAPVMAKVLKNYFHKIDGIIKSPSKRTTETSTYFQETFNLNNDVVLTEEQLYHGSVDNLMDAIQGLPEDWESVMLFAHNPGMTYLAEYLGMTEIVNVPTCGMLIAESSTDDWAMVNNKNTKILAFEYPKKYSN
ncbi:SixA phosphatase family protein [Portibacter lacus]|uniref:Phosphoglycerate mutase n=1 Tax=Portibacter lacus TaxID=1099794 RepID=A0AA37WF60_9BACT|nr:histidine phosphatase family protein [Portibacter lacus]GLR17444.1 phosphoglycerate mutase [Portibacter lacus]